MSLALPPNDEPRRPHVKTLANRGDKDEILERLRRLRPDSTRLWGRMTPHQAVCHLNDSFLAVMGEKQVTLIGNFVHRTLLKQFALYAPLRWPQGIQTLPEVDQEKGGTPPVEFARDALELGRTVERIRCKERDFAWTPHPIFGLMSEKDYLRWGYLHMDHHLRQFGV
jgi:hypothetical protein